MSLVLNKGFPTLTAGEKLRRAMYLERPLQIIGVINPTHALLAQRAGFRAIYLSNATAGSPDFPDLGVDTFEDILIDVRRMTDVCELPLVVDICTGLAVPTFHLGRSIRSLIKAGAAACQISDQVSAKYCGERACNEILSTAEMCERVKTAAEARTDMKFFVIARTSAIHTEGVDAAIERALSYIEAGADAIWAEAPSDLALYEKLVNVLKVPVIADFDTPDQTSLLTRDQLATAGVEIVLYSQLAVRAANTAAQRVYAAIRRDDQRHHVAVSSQIRGQLHSSGDHCAGKPKSDVPFF